MGPKAQRRGIRTVALISQDYPTSTTTAGIKAEAPRAGLAITYEESVRRLGHGFSISDRAKPQLPAGRVLVEALNPDWSLLGEQLADGASATSVGRGAVLSQRPELFEGGVVHGHDLRDIRFKERFEEKYPGTQSRRT